MISIGNLQINKLFLGNLEVAKAYLGDVQVYGSTPQPVEKYMTMTVLDGDAGTTIAPTVNGTLSPNLQYRINNGSWNDFIVGTTADIKVVAGDVVQWKGNNTGGVSTSDINYLNFAISGNPVALSGNVMSLIDGVGDSTVIPCNYCFCRLFRNSVIKTVSSDFLPATTLAEECYTNMFSRCTSLVNSPELPATTLIRECYSSMFWGCTSLTTAPELPATTLTYSCYRGMFEGCTSLTTAPELPATTLAVNCYAEMFYGCTSLATAPALPATTLADNCYISMFYGCTALTTAPALPATTIAGSCYDMMFQGCSSLVDAPALPATKLADRCYSSMFEGCTSLTTAPALPATTLYTWCYYSMFSGCTSLVNVPKILPATTLYDYCYASMFYGCTSLVNVPKILPATKLAYECYASMFSGCTSLTTAPVLPATTLANNCYTNMFYGCKNLNYVKCLATDITATDALKDWLYKVAVSGTFVKMYGVSYPTGISGIPEGWTVEEIVEPTQEKYMTITVDGNAGETTISPTVTGSLPNLNLQYRINNGDWTDFIVGTTADIHVVAGDVVQFKGLNESGLSIDYDNYLSFVISDNVHLSGNIMSLIDGVGETLLIPNKLCFYYLFYTSAIKTVSSDFLPAKTLKEECYRSLFAYCRDLTQAPALPATTLESYCYSEMFGGCSSLKQAPELPATKLADRCYNYMFNYCSSLNYVKCLATDNISTSTISGWLSGVSSTGTFVKPASVSYETGESGIPAGWTVEEIDVPTPPEPEGKYMTMTVLDGNKGETTIKPTVTGSLPNLNLQYRINSGDWNDFIVGTTANIHVVVGDFVQWKGMNTGGVSTSDSNYLKFIISGNNVALSGNVMSLIDGVGDALEIPCNYCFYKLFESSPVKTVSSDFIPATTLKNYCYYYMFYECTSLTTAPALPATTIAESCYRYMFWGCTSLTAAPVLPATNLAVGCYQGMFQRCSNLIQAPALPATILKDSCYKYMFSECTSLTTAPDLLATKLVDYCYNFMFDNCRKLNYVKSLAVEGLNSFNALRGWLNMVSSSGTFVKPAGVSYETGASGIPSGWTIQNI